MTPPRPQSRSARLARLMLVMTIACAASGMLLDWRVDGLMASARSGMLLQDELNRADEIATILLLFTLVINAAAVVAFGVWLFRARRALAAVIPVLAIPILNPVIPLVARAFEHGLTISLAAKAAAVAAAILAFATVRAHARYTATSDQSADGAEPLLTSQT